MKEKRITFGNQSDDSHGPQGTDVGRGQLEVRTSVRHEISQIQRACGAGAESAFTSEVSLQKLRRFG